MAQVLITYDEYVRFLKYEKRSYELNKEKYEKHSYALNKEKYRALSKKAYADPVKRERKLLQMKEYRAKKKLEKERLNITIILS